MLGRQPVVDRHDGRRELLDERPCGGISGVAVADYPAATMEEDGDVARRVVRLVHADVDRWWSSICVDLPVVDRPGERLRRSDVQVSDQLCGGGARPPRVRPCTTCSDRSMDHAPTSGAVPPSLPGSGRIGLPPSATRGSSGRFPNVVVSPLNQGRRRPLRLGSTRSAHAGCQRRSARRRFCRPAHRR